ncbi:MAG: protein kinase [Elusimicrobia bacterium]|nr:protein kinase [Elusimicrobiota bacterium]
MRASTALASFLLSLGLAFYVPSATAEPPKEDPVKKEKTPVLIETEKKVFNRLEVPKPSADEAPDSAAARIRRAADELNKELDAAEVEADRTGDGSGPAAVIERRLPELNAAAQSPDIDPSVREQVSKYNLQTGKFDDALKLSGVTLQSQPENHDALNNRAGARYGLGDYDGAVADATKMTELDPKNATAYALRALAHYGAGRYVAAVDDAKRALSLDPNEKTAFSVLKLSEGRLPPDMKIPEEKLRESLNVQREYQGVVHQFYQAEEKIRLIAAESAARPIEKLVRGAVHRMELKEFQAVIEEAGKIIETAPDYAAGYYLRAAAYNQIGKYKEAAQDASQALALNPNDPAPRDARSWAYFQLGRLDDAMADANLSLEQDANDAYAYANRGLINEKLGDFQAMQADLKSAASLDPQFKTVLQDAVARSNLERAPILGEPPRPPRPSAAAPPASPGRRKSFVTIVTSSLVGGFLIALGLLHIMSGQWQKKLTAELKKTRDTGGIRRPSAIDASYEVGRVLGQGGMGVVYEGVDRALKRRVAIKMLRPELKADPRDRERLLEEARTVAAMHHPSIVEIFSILEDQAGLYLVFEFIEGRSVEQLLTERRRLSFSETKAILKHVCRALDYAHHHNVVHRDLKPSNIMITVEGVVKVMDFGIAKAALDTAGASSMTNTVLGTPFYMAPEQGAGAVRKESDIFSLGACLYEMVTGERPYPAPASTPMKIEARYAKPSQLAPLPEGLDALMDAALQPDPDKRIRSARDFWVWLDKIKDPSGAQTPNRPS